MEKQRIEVNHVFKSFKEKEVLKDVSLTCESGKIYGIVGHNGSGKTVLFKCICGFFIQFISDCIQKFQIMKPAPLAQKTRFFYNNSGILQHVGIFPHTFPIYSDFSSVTVKKSADTFEKVGLEPRSKIPVGKYSLGMRQRLAIGQAIMENPDILILDEPMNGLDKNGVQEMRGLFEQMKNEGKLIILASHNREDIDVLCDEVYEMENGILKKRR